MRVEIIHPRGVMMRQLPSENILKEEREVLLAHFPIYLKDGVIELGHTESQPLEKIVPCVVEGR